MNKKQLQELQKQLEKSLKLVKEALKEDIKHTKTSGEMRVIKRRI